MDDYIKKQYLPKKKKKIKKKFIIDDDADVNIVLNNKNLDHEDIYQGLKENEPVIENYLSTNINTFSQSLWKPLYEKDPYNIMSRHDTESDEDFDPIRKDITFGINIKNPTNYNIKSEKSLTDSDSDLSPTRNQNNPLTELIKEEMVDDKDNLKNSKIKAYEKEKIKKAQTFKIWKMGAKQIEEKKTGLEDIQTLYNKPLTRYIDEKDLDKMLREKVHEDDPLASVFKAKTPIIKAKGNPSKFKGNYKENRFNIPPGYRWDGVDRSNGFENKYFQKISNQISNKEIMYKWMVEDM
ncbi:unnamed protein product [Gordionus sp. m RMFG-2023]|uniref:BUD13 homolog isoform X2 n=1 Tax=Gordionus sp. m RMFG-2023 TaxID=3053472 RepID=UPI0030E45AF2